MAMRNRVHRQPFLDHSARWERERRARVDAQRNPAVQAMYRTRAWQALRRIVIEEAAGLCQWPGCGVPGTVVDHRQPHRGDNGLFHDRANLWLLCKLHHDRKTASLDGGFGNPARKRERKG